MHVRQLQHAAGAQTHASPFSFLCAVPGASLEGSPSLGALREAFGHPGIPYPCISLALLIAVRAVQKGGGLRCMWRGSIAVGRNNLILDSRRPSQHWVVFCVSWPLAAQRIWTAMSALTLVRCPNAALSPRVHLSASSLSSADPMHSLVW